MELKDISSMILEQINAEIKVMKNENSPAKHYKVWFKDQCEVFYKVDETKSKEVSDRTYAKIKQCFINCFRGLEPGMKYFEGYVWSVDIPIPLEHSWLVKDGVVVDPTLIISGDKLKKQQRKYFKKGYKLPNGNERYRLGDEYAGVEIPSKWLFKECLKTKKSGPHLFNYFLEIDFVRY